MNKIDMSEISNFIKTMVTLGGAYRVEDDWIVRRANGKPVQINKKTRKGDVPVSIRIFHPDNTDDKDCVTLHPLVEDLTNTAERKWFWGLQRAMLGRIMQSVVERICEVMTHNDNDEAEDETAEEFTDLEAVELLEPFVGLVDKKTWSHLSKVAPHDFLTLDYNPSTKTASLSAPILTDEWREENCKSWRKKDLEFIDKLYKLLEFDPIDVWKHRSTTIGIMEPEARITIFVRACEMLDMLAKHLLKFDMNLGDMQYGLSRLDEYHKSCLWYSSSAYQKSVKDAKDKEEATKKPWDTSALPSSISGSNLVRVGPPQGTMPGSLLPATVMPEHHIRRFQGMQNMGMQQYPQPTLMTQPVGAPPPPPANMQGMSHLPSTLRG